MDGLKIIRFKDRRLYISSMKERAWLHGAYPLSKSKWSFLYSRGSLILFPRSLSISLGQPQFLRFVTATVNDGGVGGAWPAHPGGTRNSSSRVVGMMVDWKKIVSAPSSSLLLSVHPFLPRLTLTSAPSFDLSISLSPTPPPSPPFSLFPLQSVEAISQKGRNSLSKIGLFLPGTSSHLCARDHVLDFMNCSLLFRDC